MSLTATTRTVEDSKTTGYSIDISFAHNPQDKQNSCAVQVKFNDEIIISLPIDAVDRTLTGIITNEALAKLGNKKDACLKDLAAYLKKEIGAKQFIDGDELEGFILPHQHPTFDRLRYAKIESLQMAYAEIIKSDAYKKIADKLDAQLKVIVGEDKQSDYSEESDLLKKYADFSPAKKLEHTKGIDARFRNQAVTTIRLVSASEDKDTPKLKGLIRILAKGDKKAYLSDETMDQDIISADEFPGASQEERENNRKQFLLSYLMAKTANAIQNNFTDVQIIAAPGTDEEDKVRKQTGVVPFRTRVYENVGFTPFSAEKSPKVMMSLSAPGPKLQAIIDKLLEPKASLIAGASAARNNGNSNDKTPVEQNPSMLRMT